jgi:hypothetical protein
MSNPIALACLLLPTPGCRSVKRKYGRKRKYVDGLRKFNEKTLAQSQGNLYFD